MMRSLFSGISGLRVHQTKMDVIANNISNVNTVGFKSSRVTFNEVFAQTLSGAASPNPALGRGGTNPMQIGLGANVASIDMLMTTGAAQRTDNPFDVMIQGDGFFIVSNGDTKYYTRAGAFRVDEEGYLTMPNGMIVNGWDYSVVAGEEVLTKSVDKIRIADDKLSSPPEMTYNIEYTGNMNAAEDGVEGINNSISFFDSLGNKYNIDVKYTYDKDEKCWNIEYGDRMYPNGDTKHPIFINITETAAAAGSTVATLTIVTDKAKTDAYNPLTPSQVDWTINGSDGNVPPTFAITSKLAFTNQGRVSETGAATGPGTLPSVTGFKILVDDTAGALSPPADFPTPTPQFPNNGIELDFKKTTQYNISTDMLATAKNGHKAGTLLGLSIGTDGIVTGRYSNGQTKRLAQIVLAQFANAAGLERVGNNLFSVTNNSGEPREGEPAAGGSSLLGGVLEMANVDLASEFTEMITTQRGFQANSRVITTSDDMLQELVNLKR